MDYTRGIMNSGYGSRYSPNHQTADHIWLEQTTDQVDTTPEYLGGERILDPVYGGYPENSPTSQGTPPLTDGSPEQGCYQDEDFTQALTPDEAAPIPWNDSWAVGYFGSHPKTADPIDPLSPAGHVDTGCAGGTVANEHVNLLDLSNDQLNENMKLFLESATAEPVPSSSSNITHPDSYSLGLNFSFDVTHHYAPSHLPDEPATTICLPGATADYSYPHSDPCPSMTQNVVAPYTQAHPSQLTTTYGANLLSSSYPLAAPAMEERGWHHQTFPPNYEQQPRTSTSRRHHRYNPYPQGPRAGPSASTSVLCMGSPLAVRICHE